jgi:hypothetical protein
MKSLLVIATVALALTTLPAAAADRSYYVTELAPQQKFDVYNDGRNTYLESIPGLVVTGATADGERFIVNGVPQQIRGFFNGKPITVIRGTPPVPKPATPSAADVSAKIKQLTEKLETLSSKVQPSAAASTAAPSAMPAPVAASAVGAAPAATPAGAAGGTADPRQVASRVQGAPSRGSVGLEEVITYRVAPSDVNLRIVLEKWARYVGWTAVWDVEKDILIGNAGEKAADFKGSVRWLLSSTELGDLVVKPCFYNNSVVRIVRKTVKCNPNE